MLTGFLEKKKKYNGKILVNYQSNVVWMKPKTVLKLLFLISFVLFRCL